MWRFLWALALFICVGFTHPASAAVSNIVKTEHATVRVVSGPWVDGVAEATLHIQSIPGWHVYWQNPGDSGAPPEIGSTTDDVEISGMSWPVPQPIQEGPFTVYGYKGEVTIPFTLKSSSKNLDINVNWLICEEICVPESGDFAITLSASTADQAFVAKAREAVPGTNHETGTFYQDAKHIYIGLPEKLGAEELADGYHLFPVTDQLISNQQVQKVMQSTQDQYVIKVPTSDFMIDDLQQFTGLIQGRDGPVYVTFDHTPTPFSLERPEPDTGLIWIILAAFLGGAILNLMPCVFPILSIKILSYVKKAGKNKKHIREEGLSFTAGVMLSFIAIAFLLVGLKSAGHELGWGFQLQSPEFILGLIFLFFFMSLSLSGFIELGTSLMGVGNHLTQKPGHKGAFFSGILATIVATPCMGPFMATAIGFALSQSNIIIFTIFLALGFGMAAPYLLLTLYPRLLVSLPKPGPWMDTFKEAMAWPLYLTVVGLVWVLSQQIGATGVLAALTGCTLIGFGVWLNRKLHGKAGLIGALTLALLLATGYQAGQPPVNLAKVPYSAEQLTAYRDSSSSVFVNMTAAWCLTCKLNEQTTLKRDVVVQAFNDEGVIYMEGDWTNYDDDITKFLESFQRAGVPLYVYYPAGGDPVILPQLLTPTTVLKVLGNQQH